MSQAYDHFNTELFDGRLPDCVIVMHRKKGAAGYFWAEQWADADDNTADELAMNPDVMRGRPLNETLSTLVHEMAHLEQQHFGKPSRNGYHNKEWAKMMDAVGLAPYNVKSPDKRTGQSCSHNIVEDGVFVTAYDKLIDAGFVLSWSTSTAGAKKAKKQPKVKYACPVCDAAVWGKPGLGIMCTADNEMME